MPIRRDLQHATFVAHRLVTADNAVIWGTQDVAQIDSIPTRIGLPASSVCQQCEPKAAQSEQKEPFSSTPLKPLTWPSPGTKAAE